MVPDRPVLKARDRPTCTLGVDQVEAPAAVPANTQTRIDRIRAGPRPRSPSRASRRCRSPKCLVRPKSLRTMLWSRSLPTADTSAFRLERPPADCSAQRCRRGSGDACPRNPNCRRSCRAEARRSAALSRRRKAVPRPRLECPGSTGTGGTQVARWRRPPILPPSYRLERGTSRLVPRPDRRGLGREPQMQSGQLSVHIRSRRDIRGRLRRLPSCPRGEPLRVSSKTILKCHWTRSCLRR